MKLPEQFLHISDQETNPLLIQALPQSAFLYKMSSRSGTNVTWSRIKKLDNYYNEFFRNQRLFLPFFSPDFLYHVDMNKKTKSFCIKSTLDNKIFAEIPTEYMSFTENPKSITDQINRIRFMDNEHLRIVSREGVEKLLDFHNDFALIAEHTIPLFKEYDLKQGF
mmetsp:Transcript_19002/g.13800  ORF Transcript_19002/g.13800 Transcript_19002/m.13800 type:complete len:165 (+) Transcript_19002:2747-3241(+)